MFDREIRISRHLLNGFRALVNDFDERELDKPVAGARNPPAYILSHLAVVHDFGLMMLGKPPLCPPDWHAKFGPGGKPENVATYAPKAQLVELVDRGVRAMQAAAAEAPPALLTRPHGVEFFQGTPIESIADVISLLLTTHFALHLGQLSLMRRQLGFAPLF